MRPRRQKTTLLWEQEGGKHGILRCIVWQQAAADSYKYSAGCGKTGNHGRPPSDIECGYNSNGGMTYIVWYDEEGNVLDREDY